jgi:hypothetical protein
MRAQTRERGPPSVPVEILYILYDIVIYCIILNTWTEKVEFLLQGKLDFISSSICQSEQTKISDTVTAGGVLDSGTQPPVSAMNFPVVFGPNNLLQKDR